MTTDSEGFFSSLPSSIFKHTIPLVIHTKFYLQTQAVGLSSSSLDSIRLKYYWISN